MIRIVLVAGARPNFMKIASVMEAFREYTCVDQVLVHTGQHYDEKLSQVFFDELEIPRPHVNLEVGSGSHATQTAQVMKAFEPVCHDLGSDLVVVVGDVNSTIACSLVAAKLGIKVAHVEAGLRSFDWTMPEEINRVLVDHLSEFLFTTEPSANENLLQEGIPAERIHFVGNTMIDTLLRYRQKAAQRAVPARFGLCSRAYALVTLHRPSNVDSPDALSPLVEALAAIGETMPVLFPVHPRTERALRRFSMLPRLQSVRLLGPLPYLDFLGLMAEAAVVLTDSGGIQEETTVLRVPCLTLRRNTERPVTVTQGTNHLVELDSEAIVAAALEATANGAQSPVPPLPELWDGQAGGRIARIIVETLSSTSP